MIHIAKEEGHSIFALRQTRIATLSALGARGENYLSQLLSRQNDWLTCLVNTGDENITYDLRIICEPNADDFLLGHLTIVLLCRLKARSETQAREFAVELKSLCEAFFVDEYEFELVMEATELESLRVPFEIKSIAEISRRAEFLMLDTLQRAKKKRRLGFTAKQHTKVANKLTPNQKQQSSSLDEHSVYHVYPFLLNYAGENSVFRLLLMQSSPLMISLRLRPTALTFDEQAFLEKQITSCESFAQYSLLHHGEEVVGLSPTLQEQARILQQRFVKNLYALKDNAALLRVEVASATKRVPQVALDAIGSMLTLPAGGRGNVKELEIYLSGGYEFHYCKTEALAARSEGIKDLAFKLDLDVLAPPQANRLRYLFDALESTTAFRFPTPTLEETPGLISKTSRTHPPPSDIPNTGHCIGKSSYNGRVRQIFISQEDRRRHIYSVGQTGTGKTTMFESMILDDIRGGEGLCVIDPHGDLIEMLLPKVPEQRIKDVVLVDPADVARPVGLNILECENEAQKYFLVQEVIAIVETLMEGMDPNMMGPMFFQHVRMILLLIMSDLNSPGTILQFYQVFNSNNFYKRFLPLPALSDPILRNFVDEILPSQKYTSISSDGLSMGGYVSSKFAGFVSDPMLRNIFGQKRSTINLNEIMNTGKILLVNLSKGRLGEVNSRLFGMFLIAKLQAAAMGRANIAIDKRRDFFLYVDEFQNIATRNFGALLSEARKFRLNLILTNQFISQIDPRISSAIAGNVGTVIAYRTGSLDAEFLEREFVPVFNRYDLMQLPNFTACVSTLINGQVSRPFTMQNIIDKMPLDQKRSNAIREFSCKKYGKPRYRVEYEIAESLIFTKHEIDPFDL